jgi:hypothetical protein
LTNSQTIDWFRLVSDLVQHGVSLRTIWARTDIAEATLRGYLAGSHPVHWRGELLIQLWCATCNQSRGDVPLTEVYIAPRVVDRKTGPVTNDESIRELERAWR